VGHLVQGLERALARVIHRRIEVDLALLAIEQGPHLQLQASHRAPQALGSLVQHQVDEHRVLRLAEAGRLHEAVDGRRQLAAYLRAPQQPLGLLADVARARDLLGHQPSRFFPSRYQSR
jgi:hypothetical protein